MKVKLADFGEAKEATQEMHSMRGKEKILLQLFLHSIVDY